MISNESLHSNRMNMSPTHQSGYSARRQMYTSTRSPAASGYGGGGGGGIGGGNSSPGYRSNNNNGGSGGGGNMGHPPLQQAPMGGGNNPMMKNRRGLSMNSNNGAMGGGAGGTMGSNNGNPSTDEVQLRPVRKFPVVQRSIQTPPTNHIRTSDTSDVIAQKLANVKIKQVQNHIELFNSLWTLNSQLISPLYFECRYIYIYSNSRFYWIFLLIALQYSYHYFLNVISAKIDK